jgi:hypothetical protein
MRNNRKLRLVLALLMELFSSSEKQMGRHLYTFRKPMFISRFGWPCLKLLWR